MSFLFGIATDISQYGSVSCDYLEFSIAVDRCDITKQTVLTCPQLRVRSTIDDVIVSAHARYGMANAQCAV